MIAVGAVDDHPVLLEGLARVVERAAPDVQLVSVAPSVTALLGGGASLDVVLLDLRLGDGTRPGSDTALLVGAGARVVVYTDGARPREAAEAVAAGALSVVLKDEPVEVLVDAVRAAHRGEAVVSARMAGALETALELAGRITDRERQTLRLYAAGLPAKSVARRLEVNEDTVKEYLKRIRDKLEEAGVHARTKLELHGVARTMGLLDDDPL